MIGCVMLKIQWMGFEMYCFWGCDYDVPFSLCACLDFLRCKRKELVEVAEEMVKAAPDSKNGPSTVKKEHQDFMEQIMGVEEKLDREHSETKKGIRDRMKEEDFEEDGFEEWRQQILRKAVDAGLNKYKKFLVYVP